MTDLEKQSPDTPAPDASAHNAVSPQQHAINAIPVASYPNAYAWYVLVSTLDLMLTNAVINYWGAREVNAIAQWAIDASGWPGLIALKFATVIFVVTLCEIVHRLKPKAAENLSRIAVAISAVPVVLTLLQISIHGLPPTFMEADLEEQRELLRSE